MSGLYFKYGTMNSSKSANLIMIRFNYLEQNFNTIAFRPCIDDRDGAVKAGDSGYITTRASDNLKCPCIYIDDKTDIEALSAKADIIFVDEAQFLSENLVDRLYEISASKVVMCFGLLTDFRRELFIGSKRLIELADSIQEIKSVCNCGKRAVVNARFDKNGNIVTEGEQIEIGAEDKYRSICRTCFRNMMRGFKYGS